ncbi:peroxisome biogenesis factor 6 [Brachionus plicatilis]|uniref:Peroxisome biogenesis factor 6 n=1 Tax=Brachionus plicatilis TaxID=10195 RepID=A0A3M7S819_BRAPC|nr:peroxisome biogenesis factor 6 [Brachionus plicatilis]
MDLNDEIGFAKKLVVSLVKSPLYSSRSEQSLDQELTLYFQETRILKLNDYFQIKNLFNQSSYFVFKIINVEPSELEVFRVNNVQTCLCQSSSIQDKCIWFGNNEPECFILKDYALEIKKVLNFYEYFHSRDKITPLLLIHGPSGSGKLRSVETACRNLSFHLCKVNCVNLAGESASAVEKRVEIFIQNSIEYGPCIILFKSFHFLFKLKDINEFNKRVINSFFNLVNSIKTKTDNRILVVCTTDSKQSINAEILAKFNQEIEIKKEI